MAEQVKINIKKLKQKRSGIKVQLTSLRKFLEKLDINNEDVESQLNYRTPKLKECFESYTENYRNLVELASELENDEDLLNIENDRCEFEDSFFDIKYLFEKYQSRFKESNTTKKECDSDIVEEENLDNKSQKFEEVYYSPIGDNSDDSDNNYGAENAHKTHSLVKRQPKSIFKSIKLPQITLPRFDGKLDKWLRFKDSFQAMIINNPQLTDVERFYYLDGNLDGEAKKTIEVVEFSDEGFKNAWLALNFKYDNKRAIIDKHMNAFFNLKPINKESVSEIRKLLDDSLIHMRALQSLGERVTDVVAVHTVKQRLDCETRKLWENENKSDKPLTWAQLVEFLQRRCQVLEALNDISWKSNTVAPSSTNRKPRTKSFVSAITPNKVLYCALCKQSHFITNCEQFLKMTIQQRYEKTRQLGLCLNCLKGKHKVIDCRGPHCSLCYRKHSSFLHMGSLQQSNSTDCGISTNSTQITQAISNSRSNSAKTNDKCDQSTTTLCTQKDNLLERQIILSTAIILIRDVSGKYLLCRALLDSASQSNFASEKLADKLRIKKEKLSTLVSGLNQSKTNIQHKFKSNIKSRISNYQTELEFLVVPEIASNLPTNHINLTNWNLPNNLELADPSFNQPKEIDILLGAEVFFKLLNRGRFNLAPNLPSLQNTTFGWIVSGKAECSNFVVSGPSDFNFCNINSLDVNNIPTNSELDKRLTRFWEYEEFQSKSSKLSLEEKKCEDIFRNSYTRDQNGRFVVKLPFKENVVELGGIGNLALKRFSYLESKLNKNAVLKAEYSKFLKEYKDLGHMVLSSNQKISDEEYYLPHHAVFKPNSSSTKLRVVFDASAKGNNDLSLNDVLMTGPVVQSELFEIMLRFRKYTYVYTSDVEKMYRQVKIVDEHTRFQKILWRQNNDDPIQVFELTTVTYGTSAAPYLATKVLQQLGIDESKKYPLASKTIYST